jgi:hypothetical protein
MANKVHWKLLNANSVQFFFSTQLLRPPRGGGHTLGTTELIPYGEYIKRQTFVLYWSFWSHEKTSLQEVACFYKFMFLRTTQVRSLVFKNSLRMKFFFSVCWILSVEENKSVEEIIFLQQQNSCIHTASIDFRCYTFWSLQSILSVHKLKRWKQDSTFWQKARQCKVFNLPTKENGCKIRNLSE